MRLLYQQPASQPPTRPSGEEKPRGSRGLYLGDSRSRVEALYGRRALCERVIRSDADTRLTYPLQGCLLIVHLKEDRVTRVEIQTV